MTSRQSTQVCTQLTRPLPQGHDRFYQERHSLATEANGLLCVWDEQRKALRCTFHSSPSDLRFETLTSEPPIDFDVFNIILSQNTQHVAVIGTNHISVIKLPDKLAFSDNPVKCKCTRVGHFAQSATVVEVKWHPLSVFHLVVLTTDGLLRLFDVREPRNAECFVRVAQDGHNQSASAVGQVAASFDFGSKYGWEMFSIYVLMDSGEVCCFCPVVPKRCVVPSHVLPALHSSSTSVPEKLWLEQVIDSQQELDLQGTSVAITPPAAYSPAAQGPFQMYPPDADNHGCNGCSLLVLPTVPTVLAIADAEGTVFVCVVLFTMKPSWQSEDNANEDTEPQLKDDARMLVLERIDLSFFQDSWLISLRMDPLDVSKFFIYHVKGVHCVRLCWLDALTEHFLAEEEDEAPPFDVDSMPPDVRQLLSTVPVGSTSDIQACPVVGLVALASPSLGYVAVVLNAEMSVQVLPLNALPTQLKNATATSALVKESLPLPAPSTLRKTNKASDGDLVADIENIFNRSTPHPVLNSSQGSTLDVVQSYNYITTIVQDLRENHMLDIAKARVEIEKHHRLQVETRRVHNVAISNLDQQIQAAREANELLDKRRAELALRTKSLVERFKLCLVQLDSSLPVLSDAEKEYHKELALMQKKVQALRNKDAEVKRRYERSAQHLKSAFKPDESIQQTQKNKLKALLSQEQAKLRSLIASVDNLRLTSGLSKDV
eukprot:m.91585 g.91585  ORF g.91585 m.91585 type:complete len:716 (-) comp21662_c0_seq6:110-2257(-)